MRRASIALPVLLLALVIARPAAAAEPPLGLTDCGEAEGVYQCSGLTETWDGIPLDTTVTLPEEGAGRLPLVVEVHGFGNSKYEYLDPASKAYTDNAFNWARAGYAVLTYTARGLWGSCGTPEARLANPAACLDGYIHLADTRYEVRDTQELIGRLVDEGVAKPRRIGVTGDSYGGGQTMALAALRDRTMLPDGTLVPWMSPEGRRLRIAAAAPVIPWVDLVNAAAPNGRVFSTAVTPKRVATGPVGVEKASFVNAIALAAEFATGPGQPVGEPFVPGRPMGFLAPIGTDPGADVLGWVARTDLGEPYTDADAKDVVQQMTRFHSSYYVSPVRRPPPMLMASGFTDDLFPVDEVLRFANRSLSRWPRLRMSLLLGDFGHQRATNKPAERELLVRTIHRLFDRELMGRGRGLRRGVVAVPQRCPRESGMGRRLRARHFAELGRGEVRFGSPDPQTVSSTGGDPTVAAAIDPAAGGGDGCVQVSSAQASGTADYRLDAVAERAYTLVGSPTVIARMEVSGAEPQDTQLAARLWDVAPGGQQRLVARGLYRPRAGRNVFQLHPAAWRFRPGHVARLELAGNDLPYARVSNSVFTTEVSGLRLRLPVHELPDCEVVLRPRPPLLLAGTSGAPGVRVPSRRRPACAR